MTERQFHDAVLRENAIPIELVRAELTGQKLTRDFKPSWRFYCFEGKDWIHLFTLSRYSGGAQVRVSPDGATTRPSPQPSHGVPGVESRAP